MIKRYSILLALAVLLTAGPAICQSKTAYRLIYGPTNPATCNPLTGDVFFNTAAATRGAYYCSAANTWTEIGTLGVGANQTISLPNGTAPLPSYTFNADVQSGMFLAGVNTLGLTAGTVPYTFTNTGVVTGPDAMKIAFGVRSTVASSADGLLTVSNTAGTGFTRLNLGTTGVTTPAIAVSPAVGGQTQGIIITKGDGTVAAFADLGAATNGSMIYCSNCTVANPCAGAGTGAIAKRLNGAWVCN